MSAETLQRYWHVVGESAPVAINASFTSTDSFILRQECTVVPRFGVLSLLRVRYLWYPPTVSHVIHYYDRNGHLYVGLSSLVTILHSPPFLLPLSPPPPSRRLSSGGEADGVSLKAKYDFLLCKAEVHLCRLITTHLTIVGERRARWGA